MNTLPLSLPPGSAAQRQPAAPANLLTLPAGAVRTLKRCAGVRIEVLSGRLWLTEPGDPDDHFLAGGHSHLVVGNGAVVIENSGRVPAALRFVPER